MTDELIKPMLAKPVEFDKLRFPCIAQPKVDGIRAIVRNGRLWSRTLKPIPNRYIQDYFSKPSKDAIEGLDGELTIGNPSAKDLFQVTTSGVMSEGGEPNFAYNVFDIWNTPTHPAERRMKNVAMRTAMLEVLYPRIILLPTELVDDLETLKTIRGAYMMEGMEGVILRDPNSLYKSGRATVNSGSLLKWKEWADEEGTVVGFEELLHNENPQFKDALGLSKRSSHQANKIPGNTLGALIVKANYPSTVNVGSGFTQFQRQQIWNDRPAHLGKIVKFKHFPIGQKDLPRHPIFIGFRDKEDM